MRASRFRFALAGATLAWLTSGCLFGPPPVRVEPRPASALHKNLDACALQGDVPSARTSWVLRLLEQEDHFEDDPRATLVELYERALSEPNAEGLFTLAELSFLAGKRLGDRDCFLSAALYAYLYLLGEDSAPSPFDRRFRWACDIYNRSLVRAFERAEDGSFRLEPGARELASGSLRVDVDLSPFPFPVEGIRLLPADELDVKGLSFRMRDSGLGAPLIAVVRETRQGTSDVGRRDRTSVSATAFLRVDGSLADLRSGHAVLELHSTYDASATVARGRTVPLESDQSATVAYGIQSEDLWSFDLAGLFRGREAARQNGLILPRPYEKGRVPVVLVHGTASNPSYWAELINTLSVDPVIRARCQFWLFLYLSGNPIAYSAATLRESIEEQLRICDPEGEDGALHRIVLVGHSQGGLLCRMLGVTVDADQAAQRILGSSIADLGLDPDQERLLRRCYDLHPLESVERIVFMATPHRGSFLASSWFSRMLAKMIAIPGEFAGLTAKIVGRVPEERLPPGMSARVPTSLDNMNPANPMLSLLSKLPVDPRIHLHSIIPIGDYPGPEGADDGVVEYESAHLEEAESEVLVPSGHSCQEHPRTMLELRRILREHVGEPVAPSRVVPEPTHGAGSDSPDGRGKS